VLRLAPGLLAETFTALRRCGRGEDECVAYWIGGRDDAGVADEVITPPHRADHGWYEVDQAWITTFFLDLRATQRTVRGQVHTHPGALVAHSATDDQFAIVASSGFVSVVLPYFGMRSVGLRGAYVAELTPSGWLDRSKEDAVDWS
jgi:hypothetical protein